MPQAEHGYRIGMGAATGMQHLFVPYVYRGNGPFINEPKPKPVRVTGIAKLIEKAEQAETTQTKDQP